MANDAMSSDVVLQLTPKAITQLLREGGVLSYASVIDMEVHPLALGRMAQTQRILPRYDHVETGAPSSLIRKYHADALNETLDESTDGLRERYIREVVSMNA